jgi:hypothetical protein
MFATVVKTIVNNESIGSRVGFAGSADQMEQHVMGLEDSGYKKFFVGDGFEMFSYSYRSGVPTGNNVSIVIVCDLDNPSGNRTLRDNIDWLHDSKSVRLVADAAKSAQCS